jgi:hypothetical protein
MEFKTIVALIVIVLSVAGYVPYIWDIVKKKTQPHVFTWLTATLTAFIAWALQILGGAGIGSWPMLVVTGLCVCVLVLSIWRGTKNITKSDVVCLVLSFVALYLWLIVKQPILSVILITLAEVISYIPTVRKLWNDPYNETLSLYQISMFRHALAIVALENINLLTALYPAAWSLTNLTITTIIVVRRKQVPRNNI